MTSFSGDDMARLLAVMPADLGEDQGVDWAALRTAWGRGFPSDYMAFMSHYGAGAIDDSFSILVPNTPDRSVEGGMAGETRNAAGLWDEGSAPLLAWGLTVAADIVCWKTEHEDPDRWPVVVWRRQKSSPRWAEYDRGMSGFLCGLFSRDFDECPLSDTTLWGNSTPRFVSVGQEQRLLDEGLNPWTGEPDPYVNLSFDD
ncbi:hypothetical protein [Streptomyces sp. 11x1]|uniref:hypothetical protein n=1 Tax=Streptomyces sp. 11x1 TaxID=3038642 RepID=UPI002930EF48|nr:hypothetical protein [Streptomyces sp. 11x1]WNZ12104.1 hypothetical protein P8T65_34160 [Streptomyces sp. 11x1]